MNATSGFLNRRIRSEAEVTGMRAKRERADYLRCLIPVWEQRGVSEDEIWKLKRELWAIERDLRGESNVVQLFDEAPSC